MKTLLLLTIQALLFSSLYAQNMERVRKHIDTLASPSMHGRGYEMEGDKIAANYIQDQYRKSGLLSFKDSASADYFQYFKFKVNTFHYVHLTINDKKLEFGKDYLVHPASGFAKGVTGKVEYLDTLIFSNEKCLNKFLKKNLSSRLLVFPASYTKKIFALPEPVLNKVFEAYGLIELIDGKLTFSVSTYQYRKGYFQVKKEVFEKEKVKKISFGALADLRDYESQNVIGFIPGKSNPDSFIVISAHYDHLGRVGKAYFPGANDNASGISMMLELAKHYTENPPDYSIAFMAFGAEEAGLIGSKYYVEQPLFPLKKIKFLLNVDLLGTGDEGITVVNATKFSEQFELLKKINENNQLLPAVKPRGPAANSDHYFFTEKGVPAFFIYTLGGISAYHDIYDRAETLPLTKYTEVFKLLTGFIEKL